MDKRPFVTKEKVEKITKIYPTPFHLYDEKGIRENVKALKEAFSWNKGYKEYFAVKATPNPFLIDILKVIIQINPKTKLVLVGGGELENELKEYTKRLDLCDNVVFLGMRDDIPDILQTFDVFLFPSIYEGLGLALIEAQASGLNCLASTAVPSETKVTDNVTYYSLEESADKWAQKILEFNNFDRDKKSIQAIESIKKCGYDAYEEAHKLSDIYLM